MTSTPAAGTTEGARVRFGMPFNGVVSLWHDGTEITWHRTTDANGNQLDLAEFLGLGVVETATGNQPTPDGWSEQVETATLLDDGRTLLLKSTVPSAREILGDDGDGARISLSEPLSIGETMGDFDQVGFSVHVARLMLRAARDQAILLFTLRAPNDPEAHHLLSVPAEVDAKRVMRFHLGTLMEIEDGQWAGARQENGMALLDLTVPYESLLAGEGPESEQGLDVDKLIEMAQPVVEAILKPGFPFALGCSFMFPDA